MTDICPDCGPGLMLKQNFCPEGFPPILLGIKERKRKKKKLRRKKRKGLVSTPFSGHPLDALMFNLDKNFPFQREIAMK
jgi:hypothetical protein